MPTALISHSVCVEHEISPGHPECPERIDAVMRELRANNLYEALVHSDAPLATADSITLAHPESYYAFIEANAPASGSVQLDPDTAMNAYTFEASLRAAGAGVAAVDKVLAGEVTNAFCLTRPPGHHAEQAQAMGFCFFGNIAIAARHAIKHHGLDRVAIVDFDVHHGNGTEDIVDGDEQILFCSSFQYPFYPGSYRDNVSDQRVNVPLPAGCDSAGFRAAITDAWLPALEAYEPQMLFISAGFDAHTEDPLASIDLLDSDFVWITNKLIDLADRYSEGRVVSMLEGGYALPALGRCAAAHVRCLMGQSR